MSRYPFPTLRKHLVPLERVRFLRKTTLSIWSRWQQLRRRAFLVKRIGRIHLLLDTRDLACRKVGTWGCYEDRQMRRLFDLSRDLHDPVFLDVGAYFGVYTFFFAAAGRFRELHAIEAMPYNFEHLRANWFLNGSDPRIRLHNLAASDTEGEREIRTQHRRNRGGSSLEGQWDKPGAGPDSIARVHARPLDRVFPFEGRSLVVKVDVEGHEIRALQGMARLLGNNRCVLQIESMADQEEATRRLMEQAGYAWRGALGADHYFTRD